MTGAGPGRPVTVSAELRRDYYQRYNRARRLALTALKRRHPAEYRRLHGAALLLIAPMVGTYDQWRNRSRGRALEQLKGAHIREYDALFRDELRKQWEADPGGAGAYPVPAAYR